MDRPLAPEAARGRQMEPQDLSDGPLIHVELTKGLALVLDRPTGHHGGRLDLIGHILVTTQNALNDKNKGLNENLSKKIS